jgi:prepilin-type N-terminal cleavage/methylation domain-containing protein
MNKKGVTLIELIVVIAIIGIAAAFFTPSMSAWLPNYRLRGATRDLVSTMRTAHFRAISSNLPYRVQITQAPGSYLLQYRTTAGSWVSEGVFQPLPPGISLTSVNFAVILPGCASTDAQFATDSRASGGSIRLQNPKGTSRNITLNPVTGRVTIN